MKKERIIFKSTPNNWNKENVGLKRNTVRKEDNDKRFRLLNKWMSARIDLIITIENTFTGKKFHREVLDVTKLDNYYIISW